MPASLGYPEHVRIPVPSERAVGVFDELLTDLAGFEFDPLGFVVWAFPWGEPGTSLADEIGPEDWQADELRAIGDELRAGGDLGAVVLRAVAAGHGVGKSALVSWVILWALTTFEDTRGVVTANTDTQLRTKTWAELAKWFQLFIARDYFILTATAIFAADRAHQKTWRIDQVPWSQDNTESFAGLHNKGKRTLIVFDEASAIIDTIWEVTEGATTDANTQVIWCAFGNPTRTSGRFHKETTRETSRFKSRQVDSRTVRSSNKVQIAAWAAEYGEDSDFFRVRVRGLPPRAGSETFIGAYLTEEARKRKIDPRLYGMHPKILSIDPARFGDDSTIFTLRQGQRVHWQVAMSGFDGDECAKKLLDLLPTIGDGLACIVYDCIGVGADLDTALNKLHGLPPLVPVAWGIPARDTKQYFNQRAEAYGAYKEWLKTGSIPDDDMLCDETTAITYGYSAKLQIQLANKKDIKSDLGRSPDRADSLALSFVPELIDINVRTARAKAVVKRAVVWSRNDG